MAEYVILNDNKQATHSFSMTKGGGKTWSEVKDFDNIGMIIPKPFIVLDFDTVSDTQYMLKIIEDLDLKCRVMKTNKGIHVWFRSEEAWKCFTKQRLAVGVIADCKSHSKNAYVKIKSEGTTREWLKKIPMEEIEEVPKFLYPVSDVSGKFAFKGLGEGDGRNQTLYSYIVYLQSKGFKKDEIKEIIDVVNEEMFEEPLDDREISMICRDEAFKSEEEIEEAKTISKGFAHNEFGDELIKMFNIVSLNGLLYIYEDGYYQQDERVIERKMIDIFPSIKTTQRNEVLNYIRIRCHLKKNEINKNPYIINLNNTRLNVRTGELLPFDPAALEFNKIPVTYDESAYSSAIDTMLNKVFLNDHEVINLFYEMLGYCLIGHCKYQKAFFFYGDGSNGKSTVIDMIKCFIGESNLTTMGLDQVAEKFSTTELENKLVNIGDDVNNNAIKDSGTIKKLFSGDSVMVERKGERPYVMTPSAKHIYTGNGIPKSTDKTYGYYRRWCFIPFLATFSPSDDDFDPMIEEKVTKPEALSYLLNQALKGAKRLIRNGRFTLPKCVEETLKNYEIDNSTTLTWVDDENIELDYVLSTPAFELYSKFTDWSKLSGIQVKNLVGKKTFYKELSKHFDLESTLKQRKDGKRYFISKLD